MSQSIDKFLEKFNSKDAALGAALGLTATETQIFWAALSAVGEDLAIPDLTKIGGKVVKFPSPYINTLRKKKMIVKAGGRGKWSVSAQAVKKIEAILENGLPERAKPEDSAAPKKVAKIKKAKKAKRAKKRAAKLKSDPKTTQVAVGVSTKAGRVSAAAVLAKLEAKDVALGEQIAKLMAEQDGVRLGIAAIKDALE